jgi:hypothetical protein
MIRLKIPLVAIAFLILSTLSLLAGQENDLPPDLQAKLLLKILTFDRNLEERADSAVVVGIVYNAESEDSKKARLDLSSALENYSEKKVKGLPVSHVSLEYSSWSDLSAEIRYSGVSVLYITPGNADNLKGVLKASRAQRVLTACGVVSYAEEGISVGMALKGKKPQIIINISSAKAEGCDFSSQLLKLARVINSNGSNSR